MLQCNRSFLSHVSSFHACFSTGSHRRGVNARLYIYLEISVLVSKVEQFSEERGQDDLSDASWTTATTDWTEESEILQQILSDTVF